MVEVVHQGASCLFFPRLISSPPITLGSSSCQPLHPLLVHTTFVCAFQIPRAVPNRLEQRQWTIKPSSSESAQAMTYQTPLHLNCSIFDCVLFYTLLICHLNSTVKVLLGLCTKTTWQSLVKQKVDCGWEKTNRWMKNFKCKQSQSQRA